MTSGACPDAYRYIARLMRIPPVWECDRKLRTRLNQVPNPEALAGLGLAVPLKLPFTCTILRKILREILLLF